MSPVSPVIRPDIESKLYAAVLPLFRISQLVCSAPLRIRLLAQDNNGLTKQRKHPRRICRLVGLTQFSAGCYLVLLLMCIYVQRAHFDEHIESSIEKILFTISYCQVCQVSQVTRVSIESMLLLSRPSTASSFSAAAIGRRTALRKPSKLCAASIVK